MSFNSSVSSAESAAKLLTKLSGFLISCAMPAVSWPSEASFSVCTSRSCAVRRSSRDCGQVVGALAQLIEKAGILNGDDGLGSEIPHQRNLLIGEGPDFLTIDAEWSRPTRFP